MSYKVKVLCLFSHPNIVINQIKEIFFLTSPRKIFSDLDEKENFYDRWTKYYYENRQAFIYVAFEAEETNPSVLGYMMVEPDSVKAMNSFKDHAHYLLFSDLYASYPAHLHINCHPNAQGRGVGSKLILDAENDLKRMLVKGFHLITSPTSKNVNFYLKNGFDYTVERKLGEIPYLFMGKKYE